MFAQLLILVVALLAAPQSIPETGPETGPPTEVYAHPGVDMQFTADAGWQELARPGDPGTGEWLDPATGIHVLMWRTSTEQDAARYLRKMSSMMDLDLDAAPWPRRFGQHEGWALDVPGRVGGRPVRTLLAVVPSGRSALRPKEHLLHVFQLHCAADDSSRLRPVLHRLLDAVRVTDRLIHEGRHYRLYPETLDSPYDVPSPWRAGDRDLLAVRTRTGRYALVDVTVENGTANDYPNGHWGKGRQLDVDDLDFPALAAGGLHDEAHLAATRSITGRPVADIERAARPGAASGAGFLGADEDLLTVLRDDNRTVSDLGLTHADLAEPLFQVFNVVLRDLETYRRAEAPHHNLTTILYGRHEIHLETHAAKGWQTSIFDDEVLGYWEIRIWRDPTFLERRYLNDRFGQYGPEAVEAVTHRLLDIHTGEMVPFYIQRYGFYEGDTSYRADPASIAALFGLREISLIEEALGNPVYEFE